jgi:hypothetical protein
MPQWMNNLISKVGEEGNIDHYANLLIAGKLGTGKTRFLGTFPEPQFWLDFDSGMTTVTKEGTSHEGLRFRLGEGNIYEKLMSFLDDFRNKRQGLDQYRSLLLDGWSSLAYILIYEVLGGSIDPKSRRKPQHDDWWTLRSHLNDISWGIKNLPVHRGSSVLTKIDKDEQTGGYVGLFDILGGFREDIGPLYNEVYLTNKRKAKADEEGNVSYEMITRFHRQFDVKSRLANHNKIPDVVVNATFDSLYGEVYARNS